MSVAGEKSTSPPNVTIRVPLRDRTGEIVAHTLIDQQDDAVTVHAWYRNAYGYAFRTVGNGKDKRGVLLHRVVTDAPKGTEVDHLNHDPLDNRRANLRVTDKSGNMQNRGPRKNRDLPRNVYRVPDAGTYRVNVNRQHIGNFPTVEAADAAAKAARARLLPMSFEAAQARASITVRTTSSPVTEPEAADPTEGNQP